MSKKSSATIADVALKAGVSTATVSRMINGIGPISETTEERVRDAIRELDYSPKRKRRQHANVKGSPGIGPSGILQPLTFLRIGPFINQDRHPVTESLAEALHRNAQHAGRSLTVHHVEDLDAITVQDIIGDAKGVLIRTSNEQEMIRQTLDWLGDVPAVQVLGENRTGRLWLDHVSPDNVQVGALAANYLVDRGCEQLVFAATNLYCGVGLERCVSFVNAARELGRKVKVVVQSMQGAEKYFHQELGGRDVEMHITENRLELIRTIAANSHERLGLFIPTDLELAMVLPQLQLMGVDFAKGSFAIGCDHEARCMSGMDPMPATMDLHLDNIAERAIRRIIHRIECPKEPLVRISVAPDVVLPENVMSMGVSSERAMGIPVPRDA